MQSHVVRHRKSVARSQETRLREHQLRGEVPLAQQALRSVEIGEHAVEQRGALRDGGLDRAPLANREQQRKRIELPRAIHAERVAVDVVGDAVLSDQPIGLTPAPQRLVAAEPRERTHQPAPVRAQFARRQRHLVPVARDARVAECGGRAHEAVRRRSSVKGNTGFGSSAGRATEPGVWPNGWKRALLRASAS